MLGKIVKLIKKGKTFLGKMISFLGRHRAVGGLLLGCAIGGVAVAKLFDNGCSKKYIPKPVQEMIDTAGRVLWIKKHWRMVCILIALGWGFGVTSALKFIYNKRMEMI